MRGARGLTQGSTAPNCAPMPIYAYECTACGAEEEHIQKMSDDPVTTCAACGGRLKRQVSAAAFHLKGGGWYKDGYASARPAESGKDSGSKESGSKDSGSKDGGSKESGSKAGGSKDGGGKASGGKASTGSGD